MDILKIESRKNLRLQAELESKIRALPKGTIKARHVNKKTYYYLAFREDDKVINKYLGNNENSVLKISEELSVRKTYEIELKNLKDDWKIYRKAGIIENENSLRKVIEDTSSGANFGLSLRGFLDAFYADKTDEKKLSEHIAEEPALCARVADFQYSICAATAHKLANDFKLEVPPWVWKARYYLKDMYFGGVGKSNLRIYNMLYSPPEFKHRNLFVDENILKRV